MKFSFRRHKVESEPVDPHVEFVAALKSDSPIFDEMQRNASADIRAAVRRRVAAQTPAGLGEETPSHPNGLSLVSGPGGDGPAGHATGRGDVATTQTVAPSGTNTPTRIDAEEAEPTNG